MKNKGHPTVNNSRERPVVLLVFLFVQVGSFYGRKDNAAPPSAAELRLGTILITMRNCSSNQTDQAPRKWYVQVRFVGPPVALDANVLDRGSSGPAPKEAPSNGDEHMHFAVQPR